MENKKFEMPQLEIVVLTNEDIITNSGELEDPYAPGDKD